MKPRLPLLFLAGCTLAAAASHAADATWKLVWSDEFDRAGTPDPAKWAYETGFVRNKESQYYTSARPENARVENGHLIVEARKEHFEIPRLSRGTTTASATTPPPTPTGYTAASLITRGKAEWKYGRFEVRAKLPTGRGIWPAIWMLGTNRGPVKWPDCGEIDIMEYVGFMPDTIHGNLHLPARYAPGADPVAAHLKSTFTVAKPFEAFHVYAVEWSAERISVFVDDHRYLSYENPHTGVAAWPFDQPFYLLLNVAVGGTWGGQKGIDETIFPQRMEIDYVRVFERIP